MTADIVEYYRVGFFRKLCLEWMGDGLYFGKGYWSEVGFAIATFGAGVDILRIPAWDLQSHAIGLMLWRLPNTFVGLAFFISGLLQLIGFALFFYRGRCMASRVCKFSGAILGLWLWMVMFGILLFVIDGYVAMTCLYGFGVVTYMRAVHLGWRRF